MMGALALGFFTALGAGAVAFLGLELRALAGWATRRCLRVAVKLLPPTIRDEREEEWSAELEVLKDSSLSRLIWSAGYVLAAARLGVRRRRPWLFGRARGRESSKQQISLTEVEEAHLRWALEMASSHDQASQRIGIATLESLLHDDQLSRADVIVVSGMLDSVIRVPPPLEGGCA